MFKILLLIKANFGFDFLMSLFKLRVIYNEIYLYFFKLKVKKKLINL
jgi:hypothetical protein